MACAGLALWIDLGTLHRLQHADSLLPVLVSLQRWTPFFWEQDRYGMLIPWLARPLTHPFANLLFQGFLNVSCGLSAFFLLARYIHREPSYPLVGAVGAAAFLLMAPAPYRFDYLMDANYGVWLSLGLGGLIVVEHEPVEGGRRWQRRLVALGLFVLAHWAYIATVLYLGTLVTLRALIAPGVVRGLSRGVRTVASDRKGLARVAAGFARSGPVEALLLLVAGFLAGMLITGLARYHPTLYTRMAPREWPQAWSSLVGRTWLALTPGAWPMALGGTAGLVTIVCLVRGRAGLSLIPWRAIAALLGTALVVALFLGTRQWLRINAFAPRYLIPSAFLAQAALTMLIVVPMSRALDPCGRHERPARFVAFVLMLAGVVIGYGLPSPGRVRADLDRFGGLTRDLIKVRCTHLAGDYWTVWPAVFHANLTLRERGKPGTVWGVTFRGQPASVYWWNSPRDGRIACIPLDDVFGENWLRAFGFGHFRDVERRATVRVLRRTHDRRGGEGTATAEGPDTGTIRPASLVERLPSVLPRSEEQQVTAGEDPLPSSCPRTDCKR